MPRTMRPTRTRVRMCVQLFQNNSHLVYSPEEMIWHRHGGLAAAFLVLLAFVACALPVTRSPYDLPLFIVAFAIFTSPGWPLARWVLGSGASWLARVPFSLLLGYLAGLTAYIALRLTLG